MNRARLLAWGAFALLGAYLVIGAALVPFHPDETSLLYQSRDLEAFFSQPQSLIYEPSEPLDPAGEYRALNAPLPKYVLGLGRIAAGYGPDSVATDWDWGLSWRANLDRGAMPPRGAVLGGRLASTVLLLLGAAAIYLVGVALDGRMTGLFAALLLGVNALALVHGRRAMAEGTLIFGVSIALLGAVHAPRRPWLAGLAAAAAFGSKHSALPIAAVALAASTGIFSKSFEGSLRGTLKTSGAFLVALILLNPFLWRAPLAASALMVASRQDLLQRQTAVTDLLAPYGSLDTVVERLASLLGHLFIVPPQFQEIGNYRVALQPAIDSYLQFPGHDILRGPLLGGIMLGLAVVGVVGALRGGRGLPGVATVLSAATLVQAAVLLAANPLPVQRYYIPLLPLVVLWQAQGLAELRRATRLLVRERLKREASPPPE